MINYNHPVNGHYASFGLVVDVAIGNDYEREKQLSRELRTNLIGSMLFELPILSIN
jgi:hypothetical protein